MILWFSLQQNWVYFISMPQVNPQEHGLYLKEKSTSVDKPIKNLKFSLLYKKRLSRNNHTDLEHTTNPQNPSTFT